jgi:hypothetical protein
VTVDEAIALLTERKRNLRRTELEEVLTNLKFRVRVGSKGNHRTYTHSDLAKAGFFGGRFDGGHASDAEIKLPYVVSVIGVLRKYRADLKALRGEKDD